MATAVRRSLHVYDIILIVDYGTAVKAGAVYVLDVVRPYEQAYASRQNTAHAYDYYLLRDSANTIKRSIHVYDVVPAVDYSSTSKAGLIYALDFVRPYELSYASRQNVIHAYDVITQPDSAAKSGQVTISVRDILTIPEWFFRVNKALKILEVFTPYERATASSAPTIYVEDYTIIYDLGASVNAAKIVSAFDKLITDGASYTKSYSPLFFTLFGRRTPVRYLTLAVADGLGITDYASVKKVIVIQASDYLVSDSASAKSAVAILIQDYGILTDVGTLKNRTISVYDIIPIVDYSTAVKAKVLEAKDYVPPADYIDAKKMPTVSVLDKVVADSISTSKSYSPLFFTLMQRRIPIRYMTLNVSDYILVPESAHVRQIKTASAYDYLGFDSVTYSKSYSPLLFSMLSRRVPIRYLTLSVSDRVAVSDSASAVKIKVLYVLDVVAVADYAAVRNVAVGVRDYQLISDSSSASKINVVHAYDYGIISDYVPNMSPSDIRYISLYANVGMRSMSVFDRVTVYESVWVGPRVVTVHVRDYLVSDSATVVKKSVHAYDIIALRENVNIVRI